MAIRANVKAKDACCEQRDQLTALSPSQSLHQGSRVYSRLSAALGSGWREEEGRKILVDVP